MKTIFDYATNAACPQRPVWQISPVGYKWAQAVFQDYEQARTCGVKKETRTAAEPEKIRGNILFALTQASSIFFKQSRKLFSEC